MEDSLIVLRKPLPTYICYYLDYLCKILIKVNVVADQCNVNTEHRDKIGELYKVGFKYELKS